VISVKRELVTFVKENRSEIGNLKKVLCDVKFIFPNKNFIASALGFRR